MIDWIKRKLGIDVIERELVHMRKVIGRVEHKLSYHDGKPQRYDEIERARSRRYKAA